MKRSHSGQPIQSPTRNRSGVQLARKLATEVFRKHYVTLASCILEPKKLASTLYSSGVIGAGLKKYVHSAALPHNYDRSIVILNAMESLLDSHYNPAILLVTFCEPLCEEDKIRPVIKSIFKDFYEAMSSHHRFVKENSALPEDPCPQQIQYFWDEKNSETTTLLAASQYGHLEVVKLLLRVGANGCPALLKASDKGHVEIVSVLLKSGVNPQQQNDSGSTATSLMIASKNGHSEVVNILLKAGANPEQKMKYGWTALMIASMYGQSESVNHLLKAGANPGERNSGWTALMLASQNGHSEVVNLLLKAGANPNLQMYNGWTALMLASKNGHPEVASLLLKFGANPKHQSNTMWTALTVASLRGNLEVAKILLKAGANPAIKNFDGLTALAAASKNGHSEIVSLLKANTKPKK